MINFILRIYYFLLTIFWGEENTARSFRSLLGSVEQILVIIPLEESMAASAAVAVKTLIGTGKKITILLHHQIRGKFPNDHRLHYIEFYDTDLLFKRIPRFSFLRKLRALQFDLVLDLDFAAGDFTPFCILPVRGTFKAGIGRDHFEKPYSIRLQKINGEPSAIAQNYVDLLFSL
jgi:ADP-heptose:LPS heptosyltransferase